MSNEFKYDDRNLQQLFAEMEPKVRLRALKGAFRKEANHIRKVAINNLRSSVQSNKDLERGIRGIVFKKVAGFKVTIAPSAKRNRKKGILKTQGYHKNRFGREKPVLMWLENGVTSRETRGGKYSLRKAHSTGSLKRYGFLQKTQEQTTGRVTQELHNELKESVHRTARKYGCR